MLSGKRATLPIKQHLGFLVLGYLYFSWGLFGQTIAPPNPMASTFTIHGFTTSNEYRPNEHTEIPSFNPNSNQLSVYEADARQVAQAEIMRKQAIADAQVSFGYGVDTSLPSFKNSKGAEYYRNAYTELLTILEKGFSTKKATFIVENAFYEGEKEYSEFEQTIKKTGDFLREKMKELQLDENSNLAKNYLLFQFFADTLEIKSKGLKHFPFGYDFDDYWGKKDWSKMFVHKLLLTGKGQCSSLPKLYLILAEEIDAVAHLALSPNHSYIKFPDDEGRWHNIELTNNMLTTDAFILNSGFVKSEAIQNKIFMHPLDEKELLSNHFDQLALGYIRKYGYDDFVEEVLNTALEINPRNITAQLSKANLQTVRLKYATERLGITRENFREIGKYPELVQLYKSVMTQYETVDNLGYEEMPAELYGKWLASVDEQGTKQVQESFNAQPIKQKKD